MAMTKMKQLKLRHAYLKPKIYKLRILGLGSIWIHHFWVVASRFCSLSQLGLSSMGCGMGLFGNNGYGSWCGLATWDKLTIVINSPIFSPQIC